VVATCSICACEDEPELNNRYWRATSLALRHGGAGGRHHRQRRRQISLQQRALRLHRLDLRRRRSGVGLGLGHRGAVIIVVDLHDQLAGLDMRIVLHRNRLHIACNLGAERGQVGCEVSIVGGLVTGFAFPAIPLRKADEQHRRRQNETEGAPNQPRNSRQVPSALRFSG
jgi:hypothetical protein